MSQFIRQHAANDQSADALTALFTERDQRIAALEAELEHQRQQQHDNFKPLIDQLRPLILVLSPDGVIEQVNTAAINFLSENEDDLIGMPLMSSSLFNTLPDAQQQMVISLEQASNGNGSRYDTQVRGTDGAVLPVDLTVHTVKDEDQTLTRMIVCALDITERQKLQQQLEAVSQWQYALLDHIHQGIWIVNENIDTLYINTYLHDVLGYHDEDLMATGLREIVPKGYIDQFYNQVAQVLRGQPVTTEMPLNHSNGDLLWMQTSMTPLHTNQQGIYDVLIVLIDITERRNHELELAEKEATYRSVLSAMSEGVVLQDREGDIRMSNESASHILGLTMEQLTGRTSYDPRWHAIYPDGAPFPPEDFPIMVAQRTGEPQSGVVMGVHKPDGELSWIQINAVPIFDPQNNEPSAVVATFTDITEQRKAEKHRFDLALERERVRILSGFIRDASHEFRTPLANIQTSTYILQKKFCQEDGKVYLDRINQKVASINYLIDHLVLMHRLDSGDNAPTMRTPVRDIINAAIHSIGGNYAQEFIVDNQAEDVTFNCHVEYMVIAVESLLDNAIRFTPDDGQITLTTRSADSYLSIEVRDTGIGMTDEQRERAFERFYRADDAHSQQGFGLGLPVVKRIVDLHKGSIHVESQVGQGTLVRLTFPV